MKRSGSVLIAGTMTILLLVLNPISGAQTAGNTLPAASPTGSVDPKDPPAGDAAADARDNADVPQGAPDTQLQMQVQDAISKVPELSNDSVRVMALPDGLELSGSVVTGRERQAAVRIAQSYARGRKVVDHIVVSGRNNLPADNPKASHQANAQP
jgi:osmotically-inducible protein OsmY